MSRPSIKPVLVLLLFGLSVALIAPLPSARGRSPLELLVGSYSCSPYNEDVSSSLQFDATGDVLDKEVYLYRVEVLSAPPAEYCPGKVAMMHDTTLDSGCRTSGVETQVFGDGVETFFRFLCLGDRDAAVAAIANISEQLYEPSP